MRIATKIRESNDGQKLSSGTPQSMRWAHHDKLESERETSDEWVRWLAESFGAKFCAATSRSILSRNSANCKQDSFYISWRELIEAYRDSSLYGVLHWSQRLIVYQYFELGLMLKKPKCFPAETARPGTEINDLTDSIGILQWVLIEIGFLAVLSLK